MSSSPLFAAKADKLTGKLTTGQWSLVPPARAAQLTGARAPVGPSRAGRRLALDVEERTHGTGRAAGNSWRHSDLCPRYDDDDDDGAPSYSLTRCPRSGALEGESATQRQRLVAELAP